MNRSKRSLKPNDRENEFVLHMKPKIIFLRQDALVQGSNTDAILNCLYIYIMWGFSNLGVPPNRLF